MSAGGANEPNLTPFIDLFSVLICFLLMTTAWLSLESVQVQVEKKKDPSQAALSDPAPPPEKKTKLAFLMGPGKIVATEDETEIEIVNRGGEFDRQKLMEVLARWRRQYPEKRDIVLKTDAAVTYGSMIKFYDFLVSNDWSDVGISPY